MTGKQLAWKCCRSVRGRRTDADGFLVIIVETLAIDLSAVYNSISFKNVNIIPVSR